MLSKGNMLQAWFFTLELICENAPEYSHFVPSAEAGLYGGSLLNMVGIGNKHYDVPQDI